MLGIMAVGIEPETMTEGSFASELIFGHALYKSKQLIVSLVKLTSSLS